MKLVDWAQQWLGLSSQPKVVEIADSSVSWYNAHERCILIAKGAPPKALFHEMVHFAQHERGDDMFVDYGRIYGSRYWETYFNDPWPQEKEARDKANQMMIAYETR